MQVPGRFFTTVEAEQRESEIVAGLDVGRFDGEREFESLFGL